MIFFNNKAEKDAVKCETVLRGSYVIKSAQERCFVEVVENCRAHSKHQLAVREVKRAGGE